MKKYSLKREQFLPVELNEAWSFFSDPRNLALITPPDMNFRIVSDIGSDIYEGMLIEYKVTPIFGITVSWVTLITKVQKDVCFVDTQKKGPYELWEHTHTFNPVQGGVMMTDALVYALPLGWLGRMAHGLFVQKRLQYIFDYRYKVLSDLFVSGQGLKRA